MCKRVCVCKCKNFKNCFCVYVFMRMCVFELRMFLCSEYMCVCVNVFVYVNASEFVFEL